MQSTRLYLSMIPEALVASMLPPIEFGRYLAVGTHKRSSGAAIYIEVDPEFKSDFFNMDIVPKRCVPHADGSPKHSLYLGIYRVMEHIPLESLGKLYLTTRDGQVLELEQGELPTGFDAAHYLYDEICPVHPLIASSLDPVAFTRFATNPDSPLCVPKIFFTQLNPDTLIDSGRTAKGSLAIRNLPDRIQECFESLDAKDKPTKTVDRLRQPTLRWNHIKNGFYIGDQTRLLYYPFPAKDKLERDHHIWWRSATL
ncbi:MAG: hypothetical protein K9M54_01940 [Kiritimatiellales bacterium]|nr:hypothetical protein [Kiritimatiellales bacterium]